MRIAILSLLVLIVPASTILAQTFGEITGEIRDSSGGAIANAAVTVTNQATGGARTSSSNPVGVYTFPSLPPGVYDLKVTAAGFQVVTRRDVELQVQQTARIDFSLQVGEVTQTVEITGGAPLLTTEDATSPFSPTLLEPNPNVTFGLRKTKAKAFRPLRGRSTIRRFSITVPTRSSAFSERRASNSSPTSIPNTRSRSMS